MATERGKETQGQSQERKETSVGRRETVPPAPASPANPFTFMRRFMEDVDRLFSDFTPGLMPRIDVTRRSRGRARAGLGAGRGGP